LARVSGAVHPALDGTPGEGLGIECASGIPFHHDIFADRAVTSELRPNHDICGKAALVILM
jgi:hypothetical protein